MTWNIAPECVSLGMLAIIIVYSRKGSHLPTLKNRIFQGCLLVTFCAVFSNILSTVMIYNYQTIPLWITWIITTLYFMLTPLMGLAYFLYTLTFIFPDDLRFKVLRITYVIPAMSYTVLILANIFTRNIFDLSEVGGYTRGPLIVITYLIFYVYCLGCIVVTITNYRKLDPIVARILSSFPLLAFLVIFFQQLYPQIILSGSAATCALLIIYLHLQNKQISLDYLTNLPNRQELLNMLSLLLTNYPDKEFSLVVVSLREFRQINNACGQQNGDLFLKAIAQFLEQEGPAKNVYRFTGDEFSLLFIKEDESRVKQCVEHIRTRMHSPWEINDYRFTLSTAIGIIKHTDHTQTLENVISSIEYAITRAKTDKYGSVCYCDSRMLQELDRRRQIISILKEKLADQSFEMYYQPIFEVSSGKFLYAESLMRINQTPIGPIYPSEFIPIAEETGLLIEITYVILEKVCQFLTQLIELKIPMRSIHVNFSAIQFSQQDLAKKVLQIMERNHTPTGALKIEFTESTLAETPSVVRDFAFEMEHHGIMMGLDDFGTGYSNIATVISLPFATVKLDKSLVDATMDNARSASAIRNLIRTFKDLNMNVVAEGIETEAQRKLVVSFGVDQIQGYYYSRPLPAGAMIEFLQKNMN